MYLNNIRVSFVSIQESLGDLHKGSAEDRQSDPEITCSMSGHRYETDNGTVRRRKGAPDDEDDVLPAVPAT